MVNVTQSKWIALIARAKWSQLSKLVLNAQMTLNGVNLDFTKRFVWHSNGEVISEMVSAAQCVSTISGLLCQIRPDWQTRVRHAVLTNHLDDWLVIECRNDCVDHRLSNVCWVVAPIGSQVIRARPRSCQAVVPPRRLFPLLCQMNNNCCQLANTAAWHTNGTVNLAKVIKSEHQNGFKLATLV